VSASYGAWCPATATQIVSLTLDFGYALRADNLQSNMWRSWRSTGL
jgi:hypothetical protein